MTDALWRRLVGRAFLLPLCIKHLKLLFRSRATVFVLLLAPILLVLLLALSFHNANPYQITIATYSKSYSSLSDSFVEKLDAKHVVRKAVSENLCIAAVKLNLAAVCVVFPEVGAGTVTVEDMLLSLRVIPVANRITGTLDPHFSGFSCGNFSVFVSD